MTKRHAIIRMCRRDGWDCADIRALLTHLATERNLNLNEEAVAIGSSLGCLMRSFEIFVLKKEH